MQDRLSMPYQKTGREAILRHQFLKFKDKKRNLGHHDVYASDEILTTKDSVDAHKIQYSDHHLELFV